MTPLKFSGRAWHSLTVVALLLSIAAISTNTAAGVPTIAPTQSLPAPADLFNKRYCEVISAFRDGLSVNVEIYNTITLNDCPHNAWKNLNAKQLAKQIDAEQVKLNGPRYWLMNRIEGGGDSVGGKTAVFGEIQMRQVATLKLKLWQANEGARSYEERTVQRTTVWVYSKGTKVFELKSPAGDLYLMQSYAQIVDTTLNLQSLDTLGPRLRLPKGWTYSSRVLTRDFALRADGVARIIQDDLQNTYQKVPSQL